MIFIYSSVLAIATARRDQTGKRGAGEEGEMDRKWTMLHGKEGGRMVGDEIKIDGEVRDNVM